MYLIKFLLSSIEGPFKEGHSQEIVCSVFELTSDEPFVVTYHEGLFGACVTILSKLNQHPLLPKEDNLTNIPTVFTQSNFDFDDLFVCWEVEAVVVVVRISCSASLPVTQSESESVNMVFKPLNLGDRKVSDLLQGHRSDLI